MGENNENNHKVIDFHQNPSRSDREEKHDIMGGGGDNADTPVERERGFVNVDGLRVGMKAFVDKEGEYRKAEILSIQTRKGQPRFYVHYDEFNKRLNEWVSKEKFDLTR